MEKIAILCVAICFGVLASTLVLVLHKFVAYIGKVMANEACRYSIRVELAVIVVVVTIISLYFLTS